MVEVRINKEFCKGCSLCLCVCKKDVLGMSSELNAKGNTFIILSHPENCVGCKACATMCPEGAIELYKE